MICQQFRAMNTDILLAAEGEINLLSEGFQKAQREIEEQEERFSRFRPTSELSQLNRSAGAWFKASSDLYAVTALALSFARRTGGLFDPTVLQNLEAAGYDRSFDDIKLTGIGGPRREVKSQGLDYRSVELDPHRRMIRLPKGLSIDLGGIAKGWIAEQAAHRLAEYSPACAVNAGGDIFMIGFPEGRPVWEISVEDPRRLEEDIAVLHLKPGAVVTSTVTRRRWTQNGVLRHHIIDPRSGQPAETDWLSMTVWAPSAALAEVYAKVLLISGSYHLDRNEVPEGVEYLGVDTDGRLVGTLMNTCEVVYGE